MDYQTEMKDSLEYIEKNLEDVISLEQLAEKANLSKYYYHRIFHKTIGESVTKYISRRRMQEASKELIKTNRSIIDIALKYQYGSQEAFSRAFQRMYGMTPGRYRKINGSRNHVLNITAYHAQSMNLAA
jgi:AraC-like DNA-binding protein